MADSFVPITFVADELLTSTKMNLLAANQAGFHDGTALGDGIIVTRHLASNALTAAKMAAVPAGQQAWQAPTLLNSWTNYGGGFSEAAYYKDSLGMVHLRGMVRGGAIGSNAFVLPVGYRPGATLYIAGVTSGSAVAIISVAPDGVVKFDQGSSAYVSLDTAHFRAVA